MSFLEVAIISFVLGAILSAIMVSCAHVSGDCSAEERVKEEWYTLGYSRGYTEGRESVYSAIRENESKGTL